MSTRPDTADREIEVVQITLWCDGCDEEWDVLMTPEQATGDTDPDPELVTCPLCGHDGKWPDPDDPAYHHDEGLL